MVDRQEPKKYPGVYSFSVVMAGSNYKYEGEIVDETDSHLIIFDKTFETEVWLPKANTTVKKIKERKE